MVSFSPTAEGEGMSRTIIPIAIALGAAACGNGATADNNLTTLEAPTNESVPPRARGGTTPKTAETPPPKVAAPVTYTLAANGLAPGLTFGMAEADAVKAASAAFGAPTGREKNDECGEGPMNFVHFGDLQLGFQEGKFAGWSLGGARPALQTGGGIAIGTSRSALGDTQVDEESSIGPEFDLEGIGGFLDEQERVMALWAGYSCQFR